MLTVKQAVKLCYSGNIVEEIADDIYQEGHSQLADLISALDDNVEVRLQASIMMDEVFKYILSQVADKDGMLPEGEKEYNEEN